MASRTHEPEPLLTPAEVASMFRVDPKTVTRPGRALRVALAVLVPLALLCGAIDGALVLAGRGAATTAFVDGDAALTGVLEQRAAAVGKHDEAAFLAGVDRSDQRFVDRQRV